MSLFKKNVYELVCKDATSGKEAWVMLREYIGDMVYSKIENTPYQDMFDIIFENVFVIVDNENIKARNIKEINKTINTLIENELTKNMVI